MAFFNRFGTPQVGRRRPPLRRRREGRLQQLQCADDFVGIRCHRQLPDHALQRGAEHRQQVNARRLRRGAAAKSLAVNRDVASCLLTTHPVAKHTLKSADIQPREKHRWRWNPRPANPNAGPRIAGQRSGPSSNTLFIAPTSQKKLPPQSTAGLVSRYRLPSACRLSGTNESACDKLPTSPATNGICDHVRPIRTTSLIGTIFLSSRLITKST